MGELCGGALLAPSRSTSVPPEFLAAAGISDVGAFRTKFWKLDYFLKAVRLAVEWAIENRAVFDFLCHPSCMVVEDPEFKTVQLICDLVKASSDKAEIVGLGEVAHCVRG